MAINLTVMKNPHRRLSRRNTMSYFFPVNGDDQTIFLRYGKCECGQKIFSVENMIHGFEHEMVEMECVRIVHEEQPFTKKMMRAYDNLSFMWHKYIYRHSCEFCGGIQFG